MEYVLKRKDVPKSVEIELDDITRALILPFDIDPKSPVEFYPWELSINLLPKNWQLGLIVGASGTGKSTLLKEFGDVRSYSWATNKSIAAHLPINDAHDRLFAVGLNSVPTWRKPYFVLSTGEKFRADLARTIGNNAIIDEYTSVVSRAVAKSASVALKRWLNTKSIKGMVLASCHFDVIEWLQPSWMFNTDTGTLTIGESVDNRQWWMAHVNTNAAGEMIWRTCS